MKKAEVENAEEAAYAEHYKKLLRESLAAQNEPVYGGDEAPCPESAENARVFLEALYMNNRLLPTECSVEADRDTSFDWNLSGLTMMLSFSKDGVVSWVGTGFDGERWRVTGHEQYVPANGIPPEFSKLLEVMEGRADV